MLTAENPTPLRGRRTVIAGGTTGIGRATAVRLVREGAKVLIFGRHDEPLQEALADLEREAANGGEAYGLTAEIANYDEVRRAFAMADERMGGVDTLVNCAAVAVTSVTEAKPEEWDYSVRANVIGYMNTAAEAIPRMKAAGGGHIVNIGSMSAEEKSGGSDVYVATKMANRGFSASLRKKVGGDNIAVGLIEPGLVGTDMAAENHPVPEQREMIAKGEMLKAEDVAGAVLYMLVQPNRSSVVELQIRPLGQDI